MLRFVDIPQRDKPSIGVNPERVAYVRARTGDACSIIFDGFAGGLHQLEVPLTKAEVEKLLTAPAEYVSTITEIDPSHQDTAEAYREARRQEALAAPAKVAQSKKGDKAPPPPPPTPVTD